GDSVKLRRGLSSRAKREICLPAAERAAEKQKQLPRFARDDNRLGSTESRIPNPESRIPNPAAMTDTIFHKIIRRELPADIVYEDDDIIAFRDIAPQAPVHVLFVPKTDVATLNDLREDQAAIVGRLAFAAARYAKEQGFA